MSNNTYSVWIRIHNMSEINRWLHKNSKVEDYTWVLNENSNIRKIKFLKEETAVQFALKFNCGK